MRRDDVVMLDELVGCGMRVLTNKKEKEKKRTNDGVEDVEKGPSEGVGDVEKEGEERDGGSDGEVEEDQGSTVDPRDVLVLFDVRIHVWR